MRLTVEMFDQIVSALRSDGARDKDKRREPRVGMAGEADLVTVDEHHKRVAGKVRVRDLSATGVGLYYAGKLAKGQRFVLQLSASSGDPVWLVCLTAYCRKVDGGANSVGAKIQQVMRSDQISKVESQVASSGPVYQATPIDVADVSRISKAILD